jgi:hypothetical protein
MIWRGTSGLGSITTLVGFMQPWAGYTLRVPAVAGIPELTLPTIYRSGYDIATGISVAVPVIGQVQVVEGVWVVWLVMLSAIITLACALCPGGRQTAIALGTTALVSSLFGLLMACLALRDHTVPTTVLGLVISLFVTVSAAHGWWISLAGFVLSAGGGGLALFTLPEPVKPGLKPYTVPPTSFDDDPFGFN